jgi:hypothetical protein
LIETLQNKEAISQTKEPEEEQSKLEKYLNINSKKEEV